MDVCARAQTHAQSYSASFYCADVCINTPEDGGSRWGHVINLPMCVSRSAALEISMGISVTSRHLQQFVCTSICAWVCVRVWQRQFVCITAMRSHLYKKTNWPSNSFGFIFVCANICSFVCVDSSCRKSKNFTVDKIDCVRFSFQPKFQVFVKPNMLFMVHVICPDSTTTCNIVWTTFAVILSRNNY